MKRNRRKIALVIVVLLLLGSLLALPIFRDISRQRTNRELIAAIKQGNLDTVGSLLKEGADPNARDEPESTRSFSAFLARLFGRAKASTGPTALHVALGWRDPDARTVEMTPDDAGLVAMLCEAGADVNAVDKNGDTPLILAVWTGKENSTRVLLRTSARMDVADNAGNTAWRFAYMTCNVHMMQALLEKHVDVNIQDSAGNCALIWAAAQGKSDVVALCLRYHANVNILDKQLGSPRYYAIKYHRKQVEEMLAQAGAHLPK